MDDKYVTYCPFCGGEMAYDDTLMSEDCGLGVEGKVVLLYHCQHCGANAEFYENLDDAYDENQ